MTHFLGGLDVVEYGDGIAGATATAVLASLGANVLITRTRDSLMRRRHPQIDTDAESSTTSVLGVLLDADKRVVSAEELRQAVPDVVVVDRCEGVGDLAAMAMQEYLDYVASRNTGVWLTISPYGLSGPRASWRASDLTVAAGATLSVLSDPSTRRPIKLAGNQALLSAGHVAALAACHGLDAHRRNGQPVHVDVSAQEAAIATGPVLRLALLLLNCAGEAGGKRYGAPSGMFACRDGLVRISVMEDHQWRGLVAALGHPEWAAAFPTSADRIEHADDVDRYLAETVSDWGKGDCERRLQELGVPSTAMYTSEELLNLPQFEHRGAYREVKDQGTTLQAIDSPFQVTASKPSLFGPLGISGLRVTEISNVLTASLAGAFLGAMGASVTKLEDPDRLDMYRRRGPYIDGVPGLDRPAYFAMMNHSKQSMTLPISSDPLRLGEVLAQTDVLIENLGPHRARRRGADAATVAEKYPGVLAVSSSGYGHTGPWSSYRAYAYNLHTTCGPFYLSRNADGEPVDMDMAWADLASGVALATVIAAWAVGPAVRSGAAVDFSMAELVVQRFNEFMAAASAGIAGSGPEDGSNHTAPYVPQGVYPTAGDRWIALSVAGEEEWQGLVAALHDVAALRDARFIDEVSRRTNQDALDGVLGEAISGHDCDGLAERLQTHGLRAAPVMTPSDLVADPHLAAREFFPLVDHAEWGPRRLIGVPWRLVGQGSIQLGSPPRLAALPA